MDDSRAIGPAAEPPLPKSEEEIVELVEEFEGATRKLRGWLGVAVTLLLVFMSLYHLYTAIIPVTLHIHLARHLLMVLVLAFLLYPGWKGAKERPAWLDYVLAALAIASLGYVMVDFNQFIYRSSIPTQLDMIFGVILILLVLEATRRTTGSALVLVVVGFIVYAFVGAYLPEPWAHRGYELDRVVGMLFMTTEGIFGVPLQVSATFIILFTIYGAFLDKSGAGKFFVDLAMGLTRRRRAGAGQAVTVAGFLLGGPSGSGVATTVTVGAIAYPLLRRAGYDREAAGGLLSAGGIGAVISPPILGAAAFIIAEILRISYLEVLVMAIIPTVLYYAGIFFMIELDARRMRLRQVQYEAPNPWKLALRYWYLLSSLVVIAVFMVLGFTAIAAVFWSTVVALVTSFLRRETALVKLQPVPDDRRTLIPKVGLRVGDRVINPFHLIEALAGGSRGVLAVAATTAAAGIIVGVVNLTGLGLKISDIIIALAGANLLLTLIYAAFALWLLGLALPITATYIIAAVIVAPALEKLGVNVLAAHMFIFYYAVLSEVSPPVGLSPMAAAALTGGNPFKTMMQAWKYTLPAFVVPLLFTVHPDGLGLLLRAPWPVVARVVAIALLSLAALASGISGWLFRRATLIERVVLIVAGLLLIYPTTGEDLVAVALIVAVGVVQLFTRRPEEAAVERR